MNATLNNGRARPLRGSWTLIILSLDVVVPASPGVEGTWTRGAYSTADLFHVVIFMIVIRADEFCALVNGRYGNLILTTPA